MTYIRPYRVEDIPAIIKIVKEVLPALPNYEGINVDEDRLSFVLQNNVKNATFHCVLLFNDNNEVVGGIAGYATPTIFSWDVVAADTFLYIEPKYRSLRDAQRLIMSYVQWAKARGAKLIKAGHTSGYGIELLLKRLKFEEVGKLYHWRGDAAVTHNEKEEVA